MADINSLLNSSLPDNAGAYNPNPSAADVASQRAQRKADATPSKIPKPVVKSGPVNFPSGPKMPNARRK